MKKLAELQSLRAKGLSRCVRCGGIKPLEEFQVNRHRKSGIGSSCKPCWSAYSTEWAKRKRDATPRIRKPKKLSLHSQRDLLLSTCYQSLALVEFLLTEADATMRLGDIQGTLRKLRDINCDAVAKSGDSHE